MNDYLVLLLGVVCAAGGGELFVRGAVGLARWARIAPGIIGATVAAFATSSPELAVSVSAALAGTPQIALGDALGSNVVNIGLILGLALVSIPYAWNVLSNGLLVITGLAGLFVVWRLRRARATALWLPYATLYLGMVLTGFGSAWYHAAPDNDRLAWDRLPMTIVFMSFFCSVVAELASRRVARGLLPALLAAGMASVWYWHITEQQGAGDLRLYALVQFLPMLLIPLLFVLYPRPRNYPPWVLAMLAFYVASKIFEFYDGAVYGLGGMVSGHTLKHVLAAASPACLLPMLWRRGNSR